MRLNNNRLTGAIPAGLGDLTLLEKLKLSNNQLEGCVPRTLRELPNLTEPRPGKLDDVLDLPWCGRTDSKPTPTPAPPTLEQQCTTGGAVPDPGNNPGLVSDCAALLAAKGILGANKLNWSADVAIAEWDFVSVNRSPSWSNSATTRRVTKVTLAPIDDRESKDSRWGFPLKGRIPAELGRLSALETLQIYGNKLNGGIPAELGNLSNLRDLELHRNGLGGRIPAELGNLASLRDLSLHDNRLRGEIPPELGKLAELRILELHGNRLEGVIPPELGNLTNLAVLHLHGNRLEGCIPAGLRIPGILPSPERISEQLGLPWCPIPLEQQCTDGDAVPDPGNNPGLVSDCAALLAAKDTLRGTTRLNWEHDVAMKDWQGVYLEKAGGQDRVVYIELWRMGLNGTIPKELGNLSELQTLHLNANGLTGSIPPELGQLSKLRWLKLYNNKLTGSIPPQLGKLAQLEVLYLESNDLEGAIPPKLGRLSKLTTLRLSNNDLTGSIPPQLGKLAQLKSLDLDHNRLSGKIPGQLGGLENLTTLYLGDNQLKGCIPKALRDLSLTSHTDAELSDDVGLPWCDE